MPFDMSSTAQSSFLVSLPASLPTTCEGHGISQQEQRLRPSCSATTHKHVCKYVTHQLLVRKQVRRLDTGIFNTSSPDSIQQ